MQLGAVIQARLDSARLPGKVLRPLAGRPLLDYLVDRLERVSSLAGVVIATSDRPLDDPIAALAAARGIDCHRGDADDVAGRMLAAATSAGFDAFVRANGDSPLLDGELVARGVALFAPGTDLVSNTWPRTFPAGQSVEVVRTAALAEACSRMTDDYEREHVTPYFYRHPDDFVIVPFVSGRFFGDLHLAVDTDEHLRLVANVIEQMTLPHWQYNLEQISRLAER